MCEMVLIIYLLFECEWYDIAIPLGVMTMTYTRHTAVATFNRQDILPPQFEIEFVVAKGVFFSITTHTMLRW